MKLYLLRHAEAFPGYPDSQRQLTDKGRESIVRLANFLQGKKTFAIDEIHHSTLVRARQTAELFQQNYSPSIPVREVDGLRPEDDIDKVIEQLAKHSGNLLLVGHNPHLTELVSKLMTGSVDYGFVIFKKSGLVALERYTSSAPLSRPQVFWTLRWMMVPKLLK